MSNFDQYNDAKARHPGMILLFRTGDFYETFHQDAVTVAKCLQITLTTRGTAPMAGFPHHSLEVHLHALLRAGHRVAICDEVEPDKQQDQSTPSQVDAAPAVDRSLFNLDERIEEFVRVADAKSADYWKAMGYERTQPPTHLAKFISDKWCRVVCLEAGRETSVYAFICLQDGFTKTLGTLKMGDIHKAAGYKAPAKHARGNVFDPDFAKCIDHHGPLYLK